MKNRFDLWLTGVVLLALFVTTPNVLAGSTDNVPPTGAAEIIPAETDALFSYLQARSYQELAAKESKPHPSAGPHTRTGMPVRVFMNAKLDQSMKADNDEHPAGAGVVKEMFTKDGKLRGWAVAVKVDVESGDGGEGWYWYEVKSTTDGSNPVAAAKGVGLCAGCHVAGTDFVLSEYPLQ
jgi:hypothetical protein